METTTNKVPYSEMQGQANKHRGSKACEMVMRALITGDPIIRPVYYNGSGRYSRVMDHTDSVKHILNEAGATYEHGNDARRGGRVGDFIKITSEITIG